MSLEALTHVVHRQLSRGVWRDAHPQHLIRLYQWRLPVLICYFFFFFQEWMTRSMKSHDEKLYVRIACESWQED